ncbi:MAG: metallophosphoesterase family protein [Planctomycetaceae bacterium]
MNFQLRFHRSISCLVSSCLLIAIEWQVANSCSGGQEPTSSPIVSNTTSQLRSPAEMYRPSVTPDRIILTWNGDPATTQSVTWRTSCEVQKGLAQLSLADPGPDLESEALSFESQMEDLSTDLNMARYHSVTFRNLQSGTKYAYRVGDGVNWSEWFQFQTASQTSEPFSFLYFGDAQNDLRSRWSRVIREAARTAPRARFMIHAGDLINRAEADSEWGEWFGAGAWLNGMIPSLPVPGNHEQAGSAGNRRLTHHWRPQFTLPENGPAGLEESCYTLTFQDLRIVGLNSNEKQEDQVQWLDRVLTENTSPWVICTFHHPMFSTGKDRDNTALRKLWKPVLDKHRVDLVLQGHDHTYGRTGLETPTAEVSETVEANAASGLNKLQLYTGSVYVVSVSGPKMYGLQRHEFMPRQAEDTQLYQVIHINGDELQFEAWMANGELYDAFTLRKNDGQINTLIEQVPNVPERIRLPAVRQKAAAVFGK